MIDRVEYVARAMFALNHHYHVALTWEQAHEEHRQFYRRQARQACEAIDRWEDEGGSALVNDQA